MKILILSHGSFAKGLYEACTMIIGKQQFLDYLCLNDEGLENFSQQLNEYLDSNCQEKVYFLCDLKFGTPHNQLMIELLNHQQLSYEIITGINLPLLLSLSIKIMNSQNQDFELAPLITESQNAIEIQDSKKGRKS